jgi:tight adherence protein C
MYEATVTLRTTHLMLDALQWLAALLAAGAGALVVAWVWATVQEGLFVESGDGMSTDEARRSSLFRRRVLPWLAQLTARFTKEPYRERIQRMLVKAGSPDDRTVVEFLGLQTAGLIVALLFALFLWASLSLRPFWIPVLAALGWGLPWLRLRDLVQKRQHAITRALPYNLDLLTLAVEAGLDFTQAVGRVVEKGRPGPLVDELRLMLGNIKLGKTREESLRLLADRADMPSLNAFTAALIQADRMGTGLGKVLRLQSTQLRQERTQRAEKLAGEAPVKMLFPLVACIFPTVFMVLFGPIIFQAVFGTGG